LPLTVFLVTPPLFFHTLPLLSLMSCYAFTLDPRPLPFFPESGPSGIWAAGAICSPLTELLLLPWYHVDPVWFAVPVAPTQYQCLGVRTMVPITLCFHHVTPNLLSGATDIQRFCVYLRPPDAPPSRLSRRPNARMFRVTLVHESHASASLCCVTLDFGVRPVCCTFL